MRHYHHYPGKLELQVFVFKVLTNFDMEMKRKERETDKIQVFFDKFIE